MIDPRDGIDKEELKEADSMMRIYARYGSLGIQMIVIVVLFTLGGHWLDGRVAGEFPVFTLVLSFVGVVGALWYLFKEVRKPR